MPLVEEPDTACEETAAQPALIYSGAGVAPSMDRLEPVSGRWLGYDSGYSTGFVLFDADGTNASGEPITLTNSYNLAASEGTSIGLAADDAGQVLFARYDASGAPVLGPLVVANEEPEGLAIAGGSGESLVVWGAGTSLRARGVDAAGAFAGEAFDVAQDVVDGPFLASAAFADPGFAVAWTSLLGGDYVTFFATTTTTAASSSAVTIVSTPTPHWVVKIVRLSDFAYALLFDVQLPTTRPVVLVVDDEGAP
ncbi:MAG: hypothetical protein WC718_18845, partial [Phycisphaerales bacterium]